MSSNLYLGNLSYQVEEDQLKELFQEYGEIKSIKIFSDKGFGFIEMSTPEEAKEALEKLNGTPFLGRPLKVDEARPRKNTYPDRYKS